MDGREVQIANLPAPDLEESSDVVPSGDLDTLYRHLNGNRSELNQEMGTHLTRVRIPHNPTDPKFAFKEVERLRKLLPLPVFSKHADMTKLVAAKKNRTIGLYISRKDDPIAALITDLQYVKHLNIEYIAVRMKPYGSKYMEYVNELRTPEKCKLTPVAVSKAHSKHGPIMSRIVTFMFS